MQKKIRTLIRIVAVALVLTGGYLCSRAQDKTTGAELRGQVIECWQGQTHPVSGVSVYALTIPGSGNIRKIIRKIGEYNSSHPLGKNDVPGTPFDQDLLLAVRSLPANSVRTSTNDKGEYQLKNLGVGKKYFILAIQPDAENELYYKYSTTSELKAGIQTITFGPDQDCSSSTPR